MIIKKFLIVVILFCGCCPTPPEKPLFSEYSCALYMGYPVKITREHVSRFDGSFSYSVEFADVSVSPYPPYLNPVLVQNQLVQDDCFKFDITRELKELRTLIEKNKGKKCS